MPPCYTLFFTFLNRMYLLFSLPWQGLKAGTKKQKYERISEKKVSTSIEVKLLIHIPFISNFLSTVCSSFSSLYAVATHQSLLLTSITAARFGLMTNRITVISKEYSEISLSVKVFEALFLSLFFPNPHFLTYFLYRRVSVRLCL